MRMFGLALNEGGKEPCDPDFMLISLAWDRNLLLVSRIYDSLPNAYDDTRPAERPSMDIADLSDIGEPATSTTVSLYVC
jgi:hypothetical protein